MIKANELRTGNWLMYNEDGNWRPLQLNYVAKDENGFNGWYAHFGWCATTLEDIFEDGDIGVKGIELTKKIVSEITPNLLDWFIEGSYILVPDEEYGWCLKVRNAAHFKEIEFGYFKYLHQLQNIYYILSQGVELEWTGSSSS